MKKIILPVLFSLVIFYAQAQSKLNTNKWRKTERDSMSKGQLLYEEENYMLALPVFEQLLKNHPNENYLKYVNGMCGLYRSDRHEISLQYLQEVYSKNKKIAEIEFDLARANH